MKVGFQFQIDGVNYIVCDIKDFNGKRYVNLNSENNNDDYKIMELVESNNKIKFIEIKEKDMLSKLLPLFIYEREDIMKKYLPIGTVVMLKNAEKRVMITGFVCKTDNDDKIYDYCGCIYPEGFISANQNLLFNHDQIDKVFYMGLIDEEEKTFKSKLDSLLDK